MDVFDEEWYRSRAVFLASYIREAGPLIPKLQEMGLLAKDEHDISGVRINKKGAEKAAPHLIDWLSKTCSWEVKKDIVAVLGRARGVAGVGEILIEEFYNTLEADDREYRWSIGSAIYDLKDKTILEDVVRIAKNKEHGSDRQMFVMSIGRIGGAKHIPLLTTLLSDDQVRLHAADALGKLGDAETLNVLKRHLESAPSPFRKELSKGIKRIEKRI